MSKTSRQHLIVRLLGEAPVTSQAQLVELLADHDVDATQTTVSRDLDELGAIKVRVPGGDLVYAMPEHPNETIAQPDHLRRVLGDWVAEVSHSHNLVVIRTPPGSAHVVASAIDRSGMDGVLGTVAGDDLAAPNHHLVAGEVRFRTWLRDQGFDWHSWSDADLHGGALDLNRYRALVIHSHPEYWTTDMFDRVSRWLDDGGTLVNLGANGIYERVELTSDADGSRTMVLRNGHPEGERDLIRFSDRPERSLLGVAFEGVLHDGDPPELQKGTATDRYAPYRVVGSEHPFFADTGLSDGDLFVTVDGEVGGARWEVDTSYFDGHEASGGPAPDNLQLLARGTLGERPGEEGLWTPDYNAHMTYYDHPGGGWVFSAGSMVFTHWMVEDPAAAQLIRNVLDAAVEP